MPFLNSEDYLPQIRTEIKSLVAGNDAGIYGTAELEAEFEIGSYLRRRYDVATIFSLKGSARNPHLVMIMVDVVLYHVHSRITPRNIPEIRELRYDNAIKWLQMVASGELMPDLPLIQDTNNTPITELRTGSAPALVHGY